MNQNRKEKPETHKIGLNVKFQVKTEIQNERNKENSQNVMLWYVPCAHPLSVDEIGLTVGTF